ncbi:MAG: LamG domain-containing protein, partial [Planctomycetota bacterium]
AQGYNTGGHFRVVLTGSRLECRLQSTTDSYTLQSSGGAVTAGQWHHVAVGFGGGGLRMYLDGVEVDSDSYAGGLGTSGGGTGNPEPWVFGADLEYSSTDSSSGWTDPFEGRIDDVRLYDQNADATQAAALAAGNNPGAQAASLVEDTSSAVTPLDLTIADPDHVTWISGGGLRIDAATLIASPAAAADLHAALTATDAFTLEAEFTPSKINQTVPERLVALSDGTSSRNFELTQDQQVYAGKVRTEFQVSGTPEAASGDVLAAGVAQHVILTYDGEALRMYRNGILEVTEPWTGDFDNWDAGYALHLANEPNGTRPWLGTLHRVAIWDGSVDQVQAQNLFNGDPPGPAAEDSEGLTYRVEWIEGP